MSNASGILPCGRAVLIKPYTPERVESIIIIPDDVRGRDNMAEQRAVVVAIGPIAWLDEPTPRCKVGDKVLVTAYAGYMAVGTADGEQYRLVNDRDIFAVIEREAE